MNDVWRKTAQYLMPAEKELPAGNFYDIYPAHKIPEGQIFKGLASLAEYIKHKKNVAVDGYAGVFFDELRQELERILSSEGIKSSWITTTELFKSPEQIDLMVSPFTGGNDPIFGKRTTLNINDFFDHEKLNNVTSDTNADINVIIGPGSSLVSEYDLLVYIDLPKNEFQFRARAGAITNLGALLPADPKTMYKRAYFVDWIILNSHKKTIIQNIDIFVDGQNPDKPVWMQGAALRKAMSEMSTNFFRVRPWFEPGAWGGTWIRDHIKGLSADVPNYAWSFELIVPENGLLIESSSILLEVSFDTLMFIEGESVLGDCYQRFGTDFPIRFDFLDTFDGGNLSLQCHPRPEYAVEHFGESFTQEETYYILDTKDNADVYLGFQEEIDPVEFENALMDSLMNKTTFDAGKYIMKHPAAKHDLFLIPYGTIHGSGKNNLVLEISSTPYIFTFKMYDWLRADLDGNPRPMNIKRGMENLFFDRKGHYVTDRLISKPQMINSGADWQLWHLPTHETHLYDVHRYTFNTSVEINTNNKCLVMSLVEGESVEIETQNGLCQHYSYAETFVIPAAAGSVKVTNKSGKEAMLINAFVK